jgi:predicted alpha/beta hydrolase family esterase
MQKVVLFIRGAGEGAYEADALLAGSLQKELGPAYHVRYPGMPLEDDEGYLAWKAQIAAELAGLEDEVILVGHSVGGSILLKFLTEEQVALPSAGLFLIATPYFGGEENWNYEELTLPGDFPEKLSGIPRIFLYHSRDDEIVPFAHLALYAAKLPQATVRESDGRGHQFRNDLAEIARDIGKEDGPDLTGLTSSFNGYLTNLKFALCRVPSFSLTMSWRQVPAQAGLVFHI